MVDRILLSDRKIFFAKLRVVWVRLRRQIATEITKDDKNKIPEILDGSPSIVSILNGDEDFQEQV